MTVEEEPYRGAEVLCRPVLVQVVCVLLAAFPMGKCTLANPPLDACIQQGEKKSRAPLAGNIYSSYTPCQESCHLCFLIFLLLFFSLSLTVSWVDVFAIMKSIET